MYGHKGKESGMDEQLRGVTIAFRESEERATYRATPETIQQMTDDFRDGRHGGGTYDVFSVTSHTPRVLALRFDRVLYIG